MEEELRSCFVAITRAREYFGYGKRAVAVSGGDGGVREVGAV